MAAQGQEMSARKMAQAQAQRAQMDDYVREVAGGHAEAGAAAEISQAKELLDRGAINQAEFDRLKEKALG